MLAKGRANKAEAYRAFADLIGSEAPAPTPARLTVGELIEAYLAHASKKVRPKTLEVYEVFVRAFGEAFGDRQASEMRAFHIEDWANRPAWNPTTQNYAASIVGSMFRWAERTERLDRNPIRHLKKPVCASRTADTLISADEHARILERSPEALRRFLTALRDTGARPGEVASVTAADFNPEAGVWVLRRHKTSHKGKHRCVYLTPALVELCSRLAQEHPDGPLFRNCRGLPWTKGSVHKALSRIRKKLGLSKRIIAYGYRHTFATDALANEVPDAQVAELLGHSSTATLHKHYAHLGARGRALRSALDRVR
jgi:integrase